jgi:7,8-dihydropterin-6-yl-methyl-4-(beta-D-ribofuranosyl)aminobenzene 5'-phosphate synthase
MNEIRLNPVDKVEIITLEDNYIDIAAMDNTDIVTRPMPLKGNQLKNSILAEHGFAAVIRTTTGGKTKTMIVDFGLSEDVAARNAVALGLDLTRVEAAALSHGHIDHFGGLKQIAGMIGKKNIDLVAHPSVFKPDRFLMAGSGFKIIMPTPAEADIEAAGFNIVKTSDPYPMLGYEVLFLGEIPRLTDFEQGMPNAFSGPEGDEELDLLEDDTAVAVHLAGKGLIILSGCAHSGIVNTVNYAKEITGISKVHVVMGGFHLTGPAFEPIIEDTVMLLKEMAPDYIVPTHCTGRKAIARFEREMPEAFVLNMSGSTLTFTGEGGI